MPNYDIADLIPNKSDIRESHKQKWSIELTYEGGYGEQRANHPHGFTETPILSSTGEPPSPITFKNWSDYAAYLSELPLDICSHAQSVIMNIALNNANQPGNDEIIRKSNHHMPVTWSVALRYKLNHHLSLESGLNYSRLTSDFEIGNNGNSIIEQQIIRYLGIPMKGLYDIYNKKAWGGYGSFGVTMEIPVHSTLSTSYYLHGALDSTEKTTINAPWQWSFGVGLGLQYNLTPNIGLFTEPSLLYYIPTGSSVETYRTGHPFTFSLPLGVRFTW